ncbi:hypothetical protein PT974_05462 [Cladobotryum mycophilum]|uniref:Uncharacterized protein n=1 Tax=Cladobotryum mycophilum TaxID=491253 RepID=A0ABR0SIT9_9HYPO
MHPLLVQAAYENDIIFVASQLLADPYEIPEETEIKLVSGNIGKPGLSLLIPPPTTRIKKATPEDWTVLEHNTFLGIIEDNFGKTSMHLSLTQYQPGLPGIDPTEHYIEEETVLRETLIQVYDSSKWICDLDILSILKHSLLSRVVCNHSQQHLNTSQHNLLEDFQHSFRLVTVDNWEELLTPPVDPAISVVRTAGNWLSRLAAVGISVRLDKVTVILPESKCWPCTGKHLRALNILKDDWRRVVLVI